MSCLSLFLYSERKRERENMRGREGDRCIDQKVMREREVREGSS